MKTYYIRVLAKRQEYKFNPVVIYDQFDILDTNPRGMFIKIWKLFKEQTRYYETEISIIQDSEELVVLFKKSNNHPRPDIWINEKNNYNITKDLFL